MISVCIPVFNQNMGDLAGELQHQLSGSGLASEIILIDDASVEEIRTVNRTFESDTIRLIELKKNVGRSRIRNLFPDHARYENLLFLDCDVRIPSGDFIAVYLDAIRRHPGKVICGGSVYEPFKPSVEFRLHWKYGRKRESRPVARRNQYPYRSFMTANFLVPRKVFTETRFDERLSGYGHEDTLYGYMLEKRDQGIIHINNPVIHEGLSGNREFLARTDESLASLLTLGRWMKQDQEFSRSVALLDYVSRLDRRRLSGIVQLAYSLTSPVVRGLLRSGLAPMPLLAFHKLGRYLQMRSRHKKIAA